LVKVAAQQLLLWPGRYDEDDSEVSSSRDFPRAKPYLYRFRDVIISSLSRGLQPVLVNARR
jgi:hypothetical protein